MKKLLFTSIATLICFASFSQENDKDKDKPKTKLEYDKKKESYTVEAGCGTCMFNMKAKGCPLAIRMKDSCYLVEGAQIDDFGDAHADDGFCNAISKAKVQGKVEGNKFIISYFKLIKKEKEDK